MSPRLRRRGLPLPALAIGLGGFLPALGGHLVFQTLPLHLGLVPLLLQLRLLLALAGLGILPPGFDAGFRLGVLEAALAGQVLPPRGLPGHLLHLPNDLADDSAGGVLCIAWVRQL